jgi:hypothetical protein
MEAYTERGQRLNYTSYVDLRSAGDTNTVIRKVKVNEVLQKMKDLFARRWNPKRVGRLIESVDYVDWRLIWKPKHLFQALRQIGVTRLSLALIMIRIKT